MPLTDRVVRFTAPADKILYLIDGGGLYLKIAPTGTKSWLYRHQGAKDSWKTLGRYPAMSLLEARNKAAAAAGRRSERTVASAYVEYRAALARDYDCPKQVERRFDADILPLLKDKRLDQVTRADCTGVLKAIADRGSLVAANRTLPDLKRFFRWCVEKGWLEANPMMGVTRMAAGGRERPKDRALSMDEVGLLIRDLHSDRLHLKTRLALGLILLTGQRPGEVLGFANSELRSTRLWEIPAERTKPRRAHRVYLSPQARSMFQLAIRSFGPTPFASLDRCALSKATKRMKWGAPFTPHDLRRTMATRLVDDFKVYSSVVGKMLNHKVRGVQGVYIVADYFTERQAAWRLWGRHLAQLRRSRNENDRSGSGNSRAVGVRGSGSAAGPDSQLRTQDS